jgi:putative ABC transport system permease protein
VLTVAPDVGVRLALVLAALLAVAVVASYAGRLGTGRAQVTAVARAVVQLAAVSLLLAAALESLAGALAFVGVMLAVASLTSARRLEVPARHVPWVALSIVVGAAPVVVLVVGSGLLPLNGLGIVPFAGIVIGGAMTAATLTGRRAADELVAQRGGYEAALALGLAAPDAVRLVLRPTAREALLPGLDQTRTVGLVTLPGAFVGVLLGGGSAAQAGAAQVLVLVGLVAAQAVTTTVLLGLVATGHVRRRDLVDLPR